MILITKSKNLKTVPFHAGSSTSAGKTSHKRKKLQTVESPEKIIKEGAKISSRNVTDNMSKNRPAAIAVRASQGGGGNINKNID